ncbi:MAG: TetR/AcrR family transcriptional regulator [Bacilli bacterium]|nr:TetR/AcrR family transcriptional regulator [Bacilli bacterium]
MNTVEKIINAALKLFAEKGFKDTTTKEIASACGYNEITLFRYFKTKEDLFRQSIIYHLKDINIKEVFNECENNLEKDLKKILNHWSSVLYDNQDSFNAIVKKNKEFIKEIDFKSIELPFFIEFKKYLDNMIKLKKVNKEFKYLPDIILNSMFGILHFCLSFNKTKDELIILINEYVEIICKGISIKTKENKI